MAFIVNSYFVNVLKIPRPMSAGQGSRVLSSTEPRKRSDVLSSAGRQSDVGDWDKALHQTPSLVGKELSQLIKKKKKK